MTISTNPTDPPEWRLYDTDLKTPVCILNGYNNELYLRLNDCGTGQLFLPINDPNISNLIYRRFAACFYRGIYQGGFVIENTEWTRVTEGEYRGMGVLVSGRGPLSFLNQLDNMIELARRIGFKITVVSSDESRIELAL